MSLAQARARAGALATQDADPAADAAFLNDCAQACEMFTPLVARDGADGLLLDITGCAHLFGGEDALRARACRRLRAAGLAARAALAATPDAARAFARFAPEGGCAPATEEARARRLPLAALECDVETALALARAGFATLGDLADRPSAALAARFGPRLTRRLDRILGREDMRITPLRAPPDIMAERHFPEPLALTESLMATLERLAIDVAVLLERRAAGGRRFEASFFRTDGMVRRLLVETAQPARDPESLMRLVRLKIDALADPLDPGFGFDAVRLAVLRSEPLHAGQTHLGEERETADDARAFAELANRLVARFGRENVRRFVARDTHDPARAAFAAPFLAAAAPWPDSAPQPVPSRPLTLFDPPQPIEDAVAEVPDGPPRRFRWRRVLHEVAAAEGPERIAPEWWRAPQDAPTRDYYRVEDSEGRRFWLFREGFYAHERGAPRWFLHGLFA